MEEILREIIEANDLYFKMRGRDQVLAWQHWWRTNRQRAMNALVSKEVQSADEPFRDNRNTPEGPSGTDGTPAVPAQSARAKRKGGCCGGRESS